MFGIAFNVLRAKHYATKQAVKPLLRSPTKRSAEKKPLLKSPVKSPSQKMINPQQK